MLRGMNISSWIATIVIALILLILGSWFFLLGGQLSWSLISPSTAISLPIEGSDTEKALAVELSARLQELKSESTAIPANYGLFIVHSVASPTAFVDAPISTSKPVLKNLDLKIQNVSVWDIIKTLNSLFAPLHFELRVRVTDLPEESKKEELQLVKTQVVLGEEPIESWKITCPKKPGGSTKASVAFDDPLDKLLFQMIFSFAQDARQEFERWRNQLNQQRTSFPNWQSLRDYMNGLRFLRAFQDNLNHEDLEAAIRFLNDLTIYAPNEPHGLYFLGLALIVDRQNEEAATVFQHLQLLLDRKVKSEPNDLKWKEMLRESNYNLAVARLWIYTPETAAKAVEILDGLIKELNEQITGSSKNAQERTANQQLKNAKLQQEEAERRVQEAQTKLEAAQVNTTQASPAKNDERTVEHLKDAEEQAEQRLKEAEKRVQELQEKLEAAEVSTTQANSEAYTLLVLSHAQLAHSHGVMVALSTSRHDSADHAAKVECHRKTADEGLARLTAWRRALQSSAEQHPGSKAEQLQFKAEQSNWEMAERVMNMRIRHAAGYGGYQKAVHLLNDKDFDDRCETAIEDLETANEARPNFSGVLQDLGTIYADERYDKKGDYLGLAQKLFDTTKQWVPNDYYQYEQLAVIHRRKAYLLHAPEDVKAEIRQGMEEANNALKHRPSSTTALIEVALLNKRSWEVNDTQDQAATTTLESFRTASSEFNRQQLLLEQYLSFVRELAQTKYPPDKLDQQVVELGNNPRLNEQTRARLADLRLHLAKVSWERKGQNDDQEAKSVLKSFRDAAASNLHNQEYFEDYLSLIEQLAQMRDTNPSGLNDLVEQIADLAKSPGLKPDTQAKLKALELQIQNRAQELHKKANKPH